MDQLPQRATGTRVEPGGGLVQKEHPGLVQQAARDVERPPHAPGQGAHGVPPALAQPELHQQLVDAGAGDAARQIPEPRREAEVLLHRKIAVQRGLLKYEADAATRLEVLTHDIVSGDASGAPRGAQQSGQEMDSGGLAGAVGAEQPEELGLAHLEVEPAERADRAEILAEAAGVDRGGGHPLAVSAREAGAAR